MRSEQEKALCWSLAVAAFVVKEEFICYYIFISLSSVGIGKHTPQACWTPHELVNVNKRLN